MAHAQFAPSKMKRILLCSASFDAEQGESNAAADEGTMLHEHMAVVCEKYFSVDYNEAYRTIMALSQLDADQRGSLAACLDYVYGTFLQLEEEAGITTRHIIRYDIEEQVDLAALGYPEVFGTPDLVVILPNLILVFDWKFGYTYVEPVQNVQLRTYAVGKAVSVLEDFKMENPEIQMHIVQPKIDNFNFESIKYADLFLWFQTECRGKINDINAGKREFNPSPDACEWCPWRGHCKARNALAQEHAEEVFGHLVTIPMNQMRPTPHDLEKMAALLLKAEELEQIIKDIKAYATRRLMSGEEFPHHKLVAGRANRVWIDEERAAEYLAEYGLDPEDMYTMELVSPAQAEKLLSREAKKEEAFTSLIHKPEGKATLVLDTDPRPQLPCGPEQAFKHLVADNDAE